ncbi:site-specific integrase, partial [Magnetococcales bacterium HHB-1]
MIDPNDPGTIALPFGGEKPPEVLLKRKDTSIDPLLEQLEYYLKISEGRLTDSSRRALQSDIKKFIAFCLKYTLATFPAEPETVVHWINDLNRAHASPASIRRYLSSLSTLHRTAGLLTPTADHSVYLALQRLYQ